jgi:integrase
MNGNKQNSNKDHLREKSARIHRRPLQLLSPEQARTLLATGTGHGHEVLLSLALILGLRAGELQALQWQDLDWEAGFLLVRLTRPTSRNRATQSLFLPAKHPRKIPLPRLVRDSLQEHALCQQQERARVGAEWRPQDLVLCTEQGHLLSPACLTPLVQDLLRQAHLPVLRFHELRHTTAHLLLLSGIAPQIVGAILGISVQGIAGHGQRVPLPGDYEQVRQAMEKCFFEP